MADKIPLRAKVKNRDSKQMNYCFFAQHYADKPFQFAAEFSYF